MKNITKIILCILVLLSINALADRDSNKARESKMRRYPRRRLYTKTINVTEDKPSAELKVPEIEERRGKSNLFDSGAELNTKAIDGRPAAPRMPQRSVPDRKPDEDGQNNWIVKALMETDGADPDDDSGVDESFGGDWGWLAEDSKSADAERESALEDRKSFSDYLAGDETEMRGDYSGDIEERGGSRSNLFTAAEKEIFVDYSENSAALYEIFKSRDGADPRDRDADTESGEQYPEMADENYIGATLGFQQDDNGDTSFQEPSFSQMYSRPDTGQPENSRMGAEYTQRFARNPRQRQPQRPSLNSSSKFKSAFDKDMGNKFKSPFEQGFNQRNQNRTGNTGSNASGYGTNRLQPIGGGNERSSGFGYDDRNSGSQDRRDRLDPVNNSTKKLPYSIRQWD